LTSSQPDRTGAKGLLVTLGWFAPAGATGVPALIGPRPKPIFGLIERLFTVAVNAWRYSLSIELIRSGK
jgi:hypothetical protein